MKYPLNGEECDPCTDLLNQGWQTTARVPTVAQRGIVAGYQEGKEKCILELQLTIIFIVN